MVRLKTAAGLFAFLLLLCLTVQSARADLYKYTDETGAIQVVDELRKVPKAKRESGDYQVIQQIDNLQTIDTGAGGGSEARQEDRREERAVQEEVQDVEKVNRQRRERIQFYRKEKESIERKIKEHERILKSSEGVSPNDIYRPHISAEGGEEFTKKHQDAIKALKKQLNDLYRRAHAEGITRPMLQ